METAGTLISIILYSQTFRLLISKIRIQGERRRDAVLLFKINQVLYISAQLGNMV